MKVAICKPGRALTIEQNQSAPDTEFLSLKTVGDK
jgi:hypothetical protein